MGNVSNIEYFSSAVVMMTVAAIMHVAGRATIHMPKKLLSKILFLPFFSAGYLFLILILLRIQLPNYVHAGVIIAALAVFIFIVVRYGSFIIQNIRKENERRKTYEDGQRSSSFMDKQTGIYNRHGFAALIKHDLLLAKRKQTHVLFFYVKINDQKHLSEEKGAAENDLIIYEAAKLVRKTFRKSDIIARVESDAFMVLLIEASAIHEDAVELNFQNNLDNYNKKKRSRHRLNLSFCAVPFDPSWQYEIDNILMQATSILAEKNNNRQLVTRF